MSYSRTAPSWSPRLEREREKEQRERERESKTEHKRKRYERGSGPCHSRARPPRGRPGWSARPRDRGRPSCRTRRSRWQCPSPEFTKNKVDLFFADFAALAAVNRGGSAQGRGGGETSGRGRPIDHLDGGGVAAELNGGDGAHKGRGGWETSGRGRPIDTLTAAASRPSLVAVTARLQHSLEKKSERSAGSASMAAV